MFPFLFTLDASIFGSLPLVCLFLRTSTPYGRSHERDRWNARRCTHRHRGARVRGEEPLMNLAVLRPPVRVPVRRRNNVMGRLLVPNERLSLGNMEMIVRSRDSRDRHFSVVIVDDRVRERVNFLVSFMQTLHDVPPTTCCPRSVKERKC